MRILCYSRVVLFWLILVVLLWLILVVLAKFGSYSLLYLRLFKFLFCFCSVLVNVLVLL